MNSRYSHYQTHAFSIIPILLWGNIAMFVINNLLTEQALMPWLSLNAWDVRHGQLWRLVSYMFLHGDFFHIFLNMMGLWMFGQILEDTIGATRFTSLYFLSGILGALAWLAVDWNAVMKIAFEGENMAEYHTSTWLAAYLAENPGTAVQILSGCVGASAGVCGVIMGAVMLQPHRRIMLVFPPIQMTMKVMAIGFMLAELLMAIAGINNGIAHTAHIGGGLAGFLYLVFLSFRRPELYPVRDRLLTFWWRITKGRQMRRKLEAPFPKPIQFPLHPKNAGNQPIPSTTEIDRLLDKVEKLGSNSLTPAEKAALVRYREQMRNRIN